MRREMLRQEEEVLDKLVRLCQEDKVITSSEYTDTKLLEEEQAEETTGTGLVSWLMGLQLPAARYVVWREQWLAERERMDPASRDSGSAIEVEEEQ